VRGKDDGRGGMQREKERRRKEMKESARERERVRARASAWARKQACLFVCVCLCLCGCGCVRAQLVRKYMTLGPFELVMIMEGGRFGLFENYQVLKE